MKLEERVNSELKVAMKAKEQAATRTIRAIKAAIMLQKTDGSGTELDEAGEIKMIQKLVKQRQDSLEIYEKQNRPDLAAVEIEEIEVLQRFLPEQIGQDQLVLVIKEIVEKTGAAGMKDMGKVMGLASKELAGRADGKTISAVVKGILAG